MQLARALILLAACGSSAPSERELLAEAQDETRRFFALAEGSDCEQLKPLMQRPETCANLVRQFKETRAHLTRIDEAKLDGRDKTIVLVMVQAQEAEAVHHWIVRAKWTPKGWKLAL